MLQAMGPRARALGPVSFSAAVHLMVLLQSCGPSKVAAPVLPIHPEQPDRTYWNLPVRQPEGSALEDPSACGECHPDQFDDWKSTLHAKAASPGLIGQLLAMNAANETGCALCHQPLEVQQRFREHGTLPFPERRQGHIAQSIVEEKVAAYHSGTIELAPNPNYSESWAKHGITCAACHVREGKIYGPPKGEKAPRIIRDKPSTHNETIRSPYFETAEFCAECHQFTMRNAAGDKPLQNTYAEVKNSVYGQNKVACVHCHMPERRHLWRGIHSPDMVQGALGADVWWETDEDTQEVVATLTLLNQGGGHSMPTYVTPRLEAHMQLLDASGAVVRETEYVIQRKVKPGRPWTEVEDTRLQPLVPVEVELRAAVGEVTTLKQWIDVDPDFFYRGVYQRLLKRPRLVDGARALLEQALATCDENRYVIHAQEFELD